MGQRSCGGWRRANLQRPHDQDQIQAEGYYPRTAEDDQAQIIEAAGARWCGFGRTAENGSWHQERTGRCDAEGSHESDDRSHQAATGWQQHSVRGFLAGVIRKKLSLNLVSEPREGGRVYRIVDASMDRVKQAA